MLNFSMARTKADCTIMYPVIKFGQSTREYVLLNEDA